MYETTTMQEAGKETQAAATETQAQQTAETAPEKVSALQKFINGLFGSGKESEAAGEEKKAAETETTEDTEKETFSRADMDAAIEAAKKQWADEAAEAERIKKLSPEEREAEDQKKKDAKIADLEGKLLRKELREMAVKALEKDGYSAGLADVLDYSSKERMEETLKNTMQIFKDSLASAVQTRLKGKTPEGLGNAASAEGLLRDQIARNIRGL